MTRYARKAGFTLVEILIVVVILGILAAIVIPQFSSASESAKASSLLTQLQTIRSQIELYQVQHQGNYPAIVTDADWDMLTGITDSAQTQYATKAAAVTANATPLGPYLQKVPANPFSSTTAVGQTAAAAAAATAGWEYDEASGEIKASMATAKAEALELDGNTADISMY